MWRALSIGSSGKHSLIFSNSIGRIIGTGIFSTPSSILSSVGSVGASLMLWVLGFVLSFCGLFVWLEYGTMFPRSGGEKVYLEAVFKKPKYLATVIFASNAILLGFTASGCIVSGAQSDVWHFLMTTFDGCRFSRISENFGDNRDLPSQQPIIQHPYISWSCRRPLGSKRNCSWGYCCCL